MSTSIAFAHDLSPICLTQFSFSNIPCGTSRILGGPISISIAFALALFQLYLVLFTYCRFVSLCTRNPGSTRKILALRGLCAYRVFDPRFVSCWPMFADPSIVRRRSARCLLKLCFRLRQTRNRMQIIDTSQVIRSSLAAALKRDSCLLFASLLFRLPHVIQVVCNFRPSDDFLIFFETGVLVRDVRYFC